MKKFLLLAVGSFFGVFGAQAAYPDYDSLSCYRSPRVVDRVVLSDTYDCGRYVDYGYHYQYKTCPSDTIARINIPRYRYNVEIQKPFYAQITSDKTIDSYASTRYGNIENIPVGEKIKFYPDFTSVMPHKNVTWRWHYDSRGLKCTESSAGTLDCVVANTTPSEVWAEFFMPGYKNTRTGNVFRSNLIKVYPARIQTTELYYDSEIYLEPTPLTYEYTYPLRTHKKVYPNYNRQPFSQFYFSGYDYGE
ncbi:hypothetical protein K9M59_04315 [Candidatus Gracilibacteria bacterium]|nr:hypothetical protein [Candidatus Gracilibacteria bacterium]MCF7819544.1 hypothetical protein [Candidatus Gracilibacteria bacterium]